MSLLEQSDLLRQEETMHILNNYQTFSAKGAGDAKRLTHQEGAERRSALGALLDHFVRNGNDSDCIYIFDNLPQDLQKELDDMAGEMSKQNVVLLKNLDDMIKKNGEQIKKNDEQLAAVKERNKILDNMVYKAKTELEMMLELNRQLGIY